MRPRLTELRLEILDAVKSSEMPINTKTIINQITSNPDPSTVYRALAYLETEGYIHSISLSRMKYFYYDEEKGCGHFLHCRSCHEILQFEECAVDEIQNGLQKRFKYRISKHVLSFEGVCSDCQSYLDKKTNAMQ